MSYRLVICLWGFSFFLSPRGESRSPKPVSAYYVVDYKSGKVLMNHQENRLTYPASLTKVMTLYLLFEALEGRRLHLSSRLRVSYRAQIQKPSKLGLRKGQTITVKEAIYSLVTKSANDVAVVVAETLGGSEQNFARLMTRKARALGMKNTTFYNASGLPHARQRTTAKDMALMGKAIFERFPRSFHYFNTRLFLYKGLKMRNHNALLGKVPGVDGLKTGYIRASGFNLITSTLREGRRVFAVVLGGKTSLARDRKMIHLIHNSFQNLKTFGMMPYPRLRPNPKKQWLTRREPLFRIPVPRSKPCFREQGETTIQDILSEHLGDFSSRIPNEMKLKSETQWALQIGAFHTKELAHTEALQLKNKIPLLRKTFIQISPTKSKTPLYRSRFVGVTRTRGQKICRTLMNLKKNCLLIQVSPHST